MLTHCEPIGHSLRRVGTLHIGAVSGWLAR
jgi:hypothetical protein